MAENTIKTRIQLKCDTEANWKRAVLTSDNSEGIKTTGASFKPKLGEVIIFSNDNTHPFSRLKIGDGNTDVLSLPFVGSHNINNIIFEETFNDFPSIGNASMRYVAIDTLTVYQWSSGTYSQLYHFQKQQITSVSAWDAGAMTELTVDDGILCVTNGTAPTLTTTNVNVITNFS